MKLPAVVSTSNPLSATELQAMSAHLQSLAVGIESVRALQSTIARAKRDIRRIERKNLLEHERIRQFLAIDQKVADAAAKAGVHWERGAFIGVRAT